MSAAVPRRAAFDDLRVGQWVTLLDHGERRVIVFGGWLGKVKLVIADEAEIAASHTNTVQVISRRDCDRGIVTILRDAPAPPVQVRREDYDALVDRFEAWIVGAEAPFGTATAIRNLIDNADAGAP